MARISRIGRGDDPGLPVTWPLPYGTGAPRSLIKLPATRNLSQEELKAIGMPVFAAGAKRRHGDAYNGPSGAVRTNRAVRIVMAQGGAAEYRERETGGKNLHDAWLNPPVEIVPDV